MENQSHDSWPNCTPVGKGLEPYFRTLPDSMFTAFRCFTGECVPWFQITSPEDQVSELRQQVNVSVQMHHIWAWICINYNLVSVLLDGASSSKSHFSQFPRSVTRATQFIRCWQANLAMPSFSGTWVAICWSPWGSSMLFSASMSKSQWRLWSSAVQIGDMGPIKPLDLSWSIH